MTRNLLAIVAALPLAACQTFSFAAPDVRTDSRTANHASSTCSRSEARDSDGQPEPIERNVRGATSLVNNFVLAYRCAEQDLANGRQYFQVPAFLSRASGLLGPVIGLSNDAILLAGAQGAILDSGNNYYAPRAKAGILNSALRAILCVKTEAVGVTYFTNQPPEQTLRADDDERVEVAIDAELQYFEMVSGALFMIESILAERLSDAGSADTTAMFDRLRELVTQYNDAKEALDDAGGGAGTRNLRSADDERIVLRLENAVLQPRLQICVLQARV